MAKKQYKVILNYNTSEKEAKKFQKYMKEIGYDIDIYKADVTNKQEVKELIQYAENRYKDIDVLINNAGISQIKVFSDITEEDWDIIMNTNLKSMFYTSQAVLSNMLQRHDGTIINISSIWGNIGASCEVHYSAAKAGVNGFTKALAKELGPSNIRVNAIAPGIIETRMNSYLSQSEKEVIKNEIPLEKIGTPDDIAKTVEWLIEERYITGQIISVDGGWGI